MTDYYQAQLIARQIMDDTGMTLDQVLKLDMGEYARLSGRPTPAQAALAALNEQEHQEPPAPLPGTAFTQQAVPEPQGVPLEELALTDDQAFLAWRQQRQSGGEGVGIFSGVGSRSEEYRAAAARHAGRTGYGREVHPEPLTGRQVRQGDAIDQRSARDRFYTLGNSFGGR